MCLLFETIKCEKGVLVNLEFHQERLSKSQKVYLGYNKTLVLKNEIVVPSYCSNGIFRCRVTYGQHIEKIEFLPYYPKEIKSLKLINDKAVNYPFKFKDRTHLNMLFAKRQKCDDIIIVKNGCITDSSISNIVFFDGNQWWTPDTPLLPGTQRAKLLSEGKIHTRHITINDLEKFYKAGLINAFNSLDNMPEIPVSMIFK
ncbi:MAG: hypothetical protein CSA36_08170 [Draconibacterium sp.]|nr:MAG: hypothetical protein CSA36_08170 [Draconibacterium sp.]